LALVGSNADPKPRIGQQTRFYREDQCGFSHSKYKTKIKLALGRSGMHNQEHTLGVTNCQIAPHETPVN
jgi:hypothetical protein